MNKPAAGPRRIIWSNLLTVISAAVLIGAEVFGLAYAAGWAVAILFGLDAAGAYVLQALLFAGGIAVMLQFIRGARRVEPFTTR
jgi:hypothetical protein